MSATDEIPPPQAAQLANDDRKVLSRASRWIRILPFFLSAVLFLSGLFSVFAPLPLMLLAFEDTVKWRLWLAAMTNSMAVVLLGGTPSLGFFVVFVLALSLSMPEFLKRRFTIEKASALTIAVMVSAGILLVVTHSLSQGLAPFGGLREHVSLVVDYLVKNLPKDGNSALLGGLEPEEWKKGVLLELPSAVLVFSLALVWLNLVLLLRLNPGRLREFLGIDQAYLRHWKAPEFLLWPTIVCGFLLLGDVGLASDIALNIFKFLMAIYALQGLGILGFFFEIWNIRGFMRILGFVVAVFVMMPLLLSLGFFDLWFDFRGKLRQS